MHSAATLPVPVAIPRRPSYLTRVLIIDDEPLFTELVKTTLDRRGEYVTRVVNDSTTAIEAARDFLPDAILLDVLMPELDGGEVSRLLEEDPILRKVPVIMLTGLISNEEISEDSVATIHRRPALAKPVTAEKLVRSIEQSLVGEL